THRPALRPRGDRPGPHRRAAQRRGRAVSRPLGRGAGARREGRQSGGATDAGPVVADSSSLIALARVGQLALLPALCGRRLVPPVIHAEVARGPVGAAELARPTGWT